MVSSTTSGSCGTYNNTASFTTGNDGSGSDSASTTVNCANVSISKTADAGNTSARQLSQHRQLHDHQRWLGLRLRYETVQCANVSITKTADAANVSAGSQIGFTVTLNNGSAGTATGLSVTDSLPPGTDVNWTIDAGSTSPGWSISGSPPNQSLVYSPTTLAGNTRRARTWSAAPRVVVAAAIITRASFTTTNDGSGSDSATETVLCATVSISKTADAASVSAGSQIGFTVTLSNGGRRECRRAKCDRQLAVRDGCELDDRCGCD